MKRKTALSNFHLVLGTYSQFLNKAGHFGTSPDKSWDRNTHLLFISLSVHQSSNQKQQ